MSRTLTKNGQPGTYANADGQLRALAINVSGLRYEHARFNLRVLGRDRPSWRPEKQAYAGPGYGAEHGAGTRSPPRVPTIPHIVFLVVPTRPHDRYGRRGLGGGNVDEERESRGVENRTALVPLTEYQRSLLALLARNRSPDSYLAGGAALHFPPPLCSVQ